MWKRAKESSTMNFMHKAARLALAVCVMWLGSMPMVNAEEGVGAPDRTAWKLTITPEKFEKYVDYPNSQVGDVIRIAVYYEAVGSGQPGKPILHKHFYYNRDGKVLGSKQLRAVTFPPDTRGPVIVKKGPNAFDSSITTA